MLNTDPAAFDAVSGEGAGIATNMTGIATVLAKVSKQTQKNMVATATVCIPLVRVTTLREMLSCIYTHITVGTLTFIS